MQLRYTIERADVEVAMAAADDLCRRAGNSGRVMLANLVGWLMIGFALTTAIQSAGPVAHAFQSPWFLAALVVTGLVLGGVAQHDAARAVRRLQLEAQAPFPVEYTLSVEAGSGIAIESRYGRAQLRWAAIDGVASRAEHVVVVMRPLSPIVVPFRAFASTEQRDAFFELVRTRAGSS